MPKLPEKKVIGITGTMGAGKSSAAALLRLSVPVADCDKINLELLQKDRPGYMALKKANLLVTDDTGEADRKKMAQKMFSDAVYKQKVETILHRLIFKAMEDWIDCQTGICAVEVPLLFELKMENYFDEIWCVSCQEKTALERLEAFRGYSPEEARARLACQYSALEKENRSDRVLYNDGTMEELNLQVQEALQSVQGK